MTRRIAPWFLVLFIQFSSAIIRTDKTRDANLSPVKGMVLMDHVISAHHVTSPIDCSFFCANNKKCKSCNYKPRGAGDQDVCQLNNATRKTNPASYKPDAAFIHYFDKSETFKSCLDYLRNGVHENGIYTITNTTTGYSYPVFCDLTSEPRSAWTLIMSQALKNNKMPEFCTKELTKSAPVKENTPNWEAYRLSLNRMQLLSKQSTHLRITTGFTVYGVDFRDYLRAELSSVDLLTFMGSQVCKTVEYVDVRGNQGIGVTAAFRQTSNQYIFHVDSYTTVCDMDATGGAVVNESSFGLYCYPNRTNPEFRGVANPDTCENVKKAAETKADEGMLHILRSVNNDLMAAEAKYHKNCFALYVSKINLKKQEIGEREQSSYDAAFQELADDLRPEKEKNKKSKGQSEEIFRVAKLIQGEIKICKGISTRPLDVRDVSLASTKQIIPDSLYWLIRLIITSDDKGYELLDMESSCRNMTDERRVLSIAQDVIHSATNNCVKLPKHTSLAMCVHHLTSSKLLITLLNRMGHCCSYDDMRAVDTSIALEVLAKAQEYGTVIPTNITPGPFVQIAADNNDINEETLDGKNTTHATTMVVYQKKAFGPDPPPDLLADHSKRRRSLQTPGSVYQLQECFAHGRRPAVKEFVDVVDKEWYAGESGSFNSASRTDVIWQLLRLNPKSLNQSLILEVPENQHVPGWSGFNSILFPDLPQQSNIGYCPMINGSSTEYSTIYTVLKHAQMISAILGQADTVITFDLAIYMKAKQIQWRYPEEFSDLVVRMGGFHIAHNYLSLLGKKYLNTGLDDVLIESGVYAAGTTSVLMKGKSYNRGVRAHKLAMEALFRLMWRAFVQWYSNTHADSYNDNGTLLQSIADCVKVVENKGHVSQQVKVLEVEVRELTSLFEAFKSEARAKSKMFAFWEQYGSMVNALLQFIKAERTGNWNLHLSAVATMLPHFFAMDRPNYARWLPVYLADMKQLETKHPLVHQEFAQGGHAVSRSGKPFAQVWTYMALEQSVNADSKSKGGIVGIS
ncbi:hypothetical protein QZH41_002114 [Actinostola sp. cb2023]|nr:hypothetical protein QZH41_002114 [Actinostola sp. cb2023]